MVKWTKKVHGMMKNLNDYAVQEKVLVTILAALEIAESHDERLNTAFMLGQTVYIMNQMLVKMVYTHVLIVKQMM